MLLTHSCPPGLVDASTELQYGGVGEPEVHCSSLPFPGNPALVCQAGNKPCPPLDKDWEWDAHIHFQVLLIRSHSPCRFPGRKGQRVKEASFTPALPSSLPFQACFSSGPTPAWGEQPAEQSCPCRICTHFHQSCLAAQEQHFFSVQVFLHRKLLTAACGRGGFSALLCSHSPHQKPLQTKH